jgi:parallel beta-helix repeat protein
MPLKKSSLLLSRRAFSLTAGSTIVAACAGLRDGVAQHSGPNQWGRSDESEASTGDERRELHENRRAAVSVVDFGARAGGRTSDGLTNHRAFQAAVEYLYQMGGGELYVPMGRYALDVARPVIVPSNITIRGERGVSVIEPDISTVTDVASRPFPLASGGVFVSGNPITFERAAMERGTGCRNIHFDGIAIECDFVRGTLSAGQQLRGIAIYATTDVTVTNCRVENLPNTGIGIVDCRDVRITNNRVIDNGFGAPDTAMETRNGISASGLILHEYRADNSSAIIISGNICNYNHDEGIQYGLQCGVIVANNVCIGNGDLGIEGDTGFSTKTTQASLGFEIPSQALVVGNFVDGRKRDGALGLGGISFSGGNEGNVRIAENMVRNVAGKMGISAIQNAGGLVVIEGNTIDRCSPGPKQNQISVNAQNVRVTGNTITRPAHDNLHDAIFVYGNAQVVTIEGNFSDVVPGYSLFVGTSNESFTLLQVAGNTFSGSGADSIIFKPTVACVPSLISVCSNNLLNVNGSGLSAPRAITLKMTDSSSAVRIQKLVIRNNTITYAKATEYAVGLLGFQSGAIEEAGISGNDFGFPFMPKGSRCVDDPKAVVGDMTMEAANNLPGQRILYLDHRPSSGRWVVGDRVNNSNPGGMPVAGWICVASGSPGAWKAYGRLV